MTRESRLWTIYRFDNKGYAAAKAAREKVAAILKRGADMQSQAEALRKEGRVAASRIMMKDSFSVVDSGLNLQKRLIVPFTYDLSQFAPNLLLNEGITTLQQFITGTGTPTAFSNANGYLGVGDSSTAASATQTGLQASTNKLYKAMDTSYPAISNQTTTWQSTFQNADANWAWNEFTVANGSSDSSVNLNRKVSAQGSKTSSQVWTLQLAITWS